VTTTWRKMRVPFPLAVGLSLVGHAAIAFAWLHPHVQAEVPTADVHATPLTGESFDVSATDESGDTPVDPSSGNAGGSSESPTATATAAASGDEAADGLTVERVAPKPSGKTSVNAAASAPASSATSAAAEAAPASFGAVGERGAVEIVPFFQRAFVQMASADPVWTKASFGTAGSTTLTLTIDGSGHLTGSNLGAGAGAALASSIARTLPLLAHRSFTAKGARSVLNLTAHVSPDAVHDGLHGNVFAIGVTSADGSGASGTAWFSLTSGRRINLTIRAR
jgi:hypothetical protein